MGNTTPREALLLQWAEVLDDPSLRDIPYKIELNERGRIELTPARTAHSRRQTRIAVAIQAALPDGEAIVECAVVTEIGVRVPDVVWASKAFLAKHGDASPLPQAPEICIEVRSPTNTDGELLGKIRAYLAAGAIEGWIVDEAGAVKIYSASGEVSASTFAIATDFKA
jgi:Uma2 family endonuclease